MLMYGTGRYIPDNTFIFNLASYVEGYQKLPYLIPPNEIGHLYGYEFDVAYANFLMQNENSFVQLYYLIELLLQDKDVFLLISGEDWTENLVQSLFKFIQQRYGYNGVCINSEEDFLHYINTVFDFNSQYGLYNLGIDRDRYCTLFEKRSRR